MQSVGAAADATADYECHGGACVPSRVHFAQAPPSPPPPAGVRSEGSLQFDGFTAATFGEAQRAALVVVLAQVASVVGSCRSTPG